jgi:hypothetical protein
MPNTKDEEALCRCKMRATGGAMHHPFLDASPISVDAGGAFARARAWSRRLVIGQSQLKISKAGFPVFPNPIPFRKWRQTLKTKYFNGNEPLRLFSTAMRPTTLVDFLLSLFGLVYGQSCQLYSDEPWRMNLTILALTF